MPKLPLFVLILLALTACGGDSGDSVDENRQEKLRVLVRNAPGIFFYNREDSLAGVEHDLISLFAANKGYEIEFVQLESVEAIIEALREGEGDIAAAGLTLLDKRDDQFLHSLPYQTVNQQLVCRRGGAAPASVDELAGLSIEVIRESSYVQRLRELKEDVPALEWREIDGSTEQLLEKVWDKTIDCTVADNPIVSLNRRLLPELEVRFDLTRSEPLVWYYPLQREQLQKEVNSWLVDAAKAGEIETVLHRYYGFISTFDYVDTQRFVRRIRERYTRYRAYFQRAAQQYGHDEALLAAQAYQESHWRPDARSPTGVRGMMMLTRNTAESLGIKDRLDPRASIEGGARYLQKMKDRFDAAITEPDRSWLALAAYNVGRAHLHDAQTLARELDKDPHAWADLKEVLPLLSDPAYYKKLKYGYARGMEPVRYVERIRNYQFILESQLAEL